MTISTRSLNERLELVDETETSLEGIRRDAPATRIFNLQLTLFLCIANSTVYIRALGECVGVAESHIVIRRIKVDTFGRTKVSSDLGLAAMIDSKNLVIGKTTYFCGFCCF